MSTAREVPHLPYLSNENRLAVYQLIVGGCQHLWSKNKLQEQKALDVMRSLVKLGQEDPYFLAHLTSWAVKQPSKDLQVLTAYTNSLSSADGRPFSGGSKYTKPNLRYLSAAAVCQMEPKLVRRVRQLGEIKFSVPGILNEASHIPNSLITSIKKYLRYREANIEILKGIKKAGLANTLEILYRSVHMSPSDEAAAILRWQQKDRKIKFKESVFGFEGMTDLEIANKIRKDKLPVLGAIGALPKITPVIAVALLEQATGNQAIILRKTFEDAGVLKDKEVMELYTSKVKEAKTAVDRVETLSKTASEEVKNVLKEARSEVRKKEMEKVGKLYLMLDVSGSMHGVIEFAKKRGTTIAECVNKPTENFRWGGFGDRGEEFPLPQEFVEDAFAAILFGKPGQGSTDAFGLYPNARQFGAEVDILVTDQGHNIGDLTAKIKTYHERHPEASKPKACVIVDFSGGSDNTVKNSYEANQIPVTVMKPDSLKESALVVTAIRQAIQGPVVLIDEIMGTELLKLPDWYMAI